MSIAIFASGNGSNFQAIVDQSRRDHWDQQVSLLISDHPEAKVLSRAKQLNIPHYGMDPRQFTSKADYEQQILKYLQEYQIEWVFLAGYMRLVGATLLEAYEGKMVNIHPSLLPAFPGLHAIEQAFKYPVKISGVTIHFIDEGMDTGPIIAQEAVPIEENDTIETYTNKIHEVEHRLYPEVICRLVHGSMKSNKEEHE